LGGGIYTDIPPVATALVVYGTISSFLADTSSTRGPCSVCDAVFATLAQVLTVLGLTPRQLHDIICQTVHLRSATSMMHM